MATADDLTEDHWDAFYQFYLDTGQRKWGSPYLTRAFFSEVHKTMPEDVLLIMAKREDRYIAGALNFIGADALFGRNWGCIEDHRFLHFEVCYYQAIDFAISRGLSRVEAGAQGSHKIGASAREPCDGGQRRAENGHANQHANRLPGGTVATRGALEKARVAQQRSGWCILT